MAPYLVAVLVVVLSTWLVVVGGQTQGNAYGNTNKCMWQQKEIHVAKLMVAA